MSKTKVLAEREREAEDEKYKTEGKKGIKTQGGKGTALQRSIWSKVRQSVSGLWQSGRSDTDC